MRFKVRLIFLFVGISFFIFLMYDLRRGVKQMELEKEHNFSDSTKEKNIEDSNLNNNENNLDFIENKNDEEKEAPIIVDDAKKNDDNNENLVENENDNNNENNENNENDVKDENNVKDENEFKEIPIMKAKEPEPKIEDEDEYLEIIQDGKKLDEKFVKEIREMKKYRGGPLEPEWKWIEDISIVYTWVNGSDLNHLDLKSKYNGGNRNIDNRDRSVDELRYSLRSLEKYLPWHKGNIFIVSPNQVPSWLKPNTRVKIINQDDLLPPNVAPTFNTFTIELFLDKIPGLTERFIQLNDDYFFKSYTHPSFFFTSKTFYPKFLSN
ncbi:hypothetical protein BCR32DRAFT_132905 [Anaeromyces robustus]|uniref:Stealth protein CR2 conserved region 2 domain-containing protein n=1 Tax=Anaeromyces robustus TaxID=1754192 RepID=A0A1Y1XET2_9FUNG|nr:hypothetical protein BCR32DRAFT_132905 [Anaeromyces robustus]|eukprot:ORX84259.1 hypothetical protein BCR32DRAFT_132905 [Anaeromyces robustus]